MMARSYNPKSRDNLRQYQAVKTKKRQAEISKELLGEIKIDERLIELIVAHKEVCTGSEEKRFMGYITEYLREYGKQGAELTISDMDDIAQLCLNNIMITRMYKSAKKDDASIADVMAAVDRLKKDNVQLKKNLGSTRGERVDPREGQVRTVMDLLDDYMQGRREDLQEKQLRYAEEEEEFKDKIKNSVEDIIH